MTRLCSMMAASVMMTVALASGGCGREAPTFEASTRYTPESLAQELAFRVRSTKVGAKSARKAGEPRGKEVGKGADAAKEGGPAATLDDVLADVDRKVGLIVGMPRSEVLRAVAKSVAADASLGEADKRLLAERLGQMADAP